MSLITLQELSIGYYGPMLLDQVNCQIHAGDRIGLLGRNGAGKSTLIRMLLGDVKPDHGQVIIAPGNRLAVLGQEVPMDIFDSVANVVAAGLKSSDSNGHEELESWQIDVAVEQMLSRMELDGNARFEHLSSGMKRRVLLAKALVAKPDFLLLDEPTNHLDIDAILWLEDFLRKHVPSFLFVTHDRVFLQRLTNRILEIDRGRLFDWSCDYDTFLVRKEQMLAAEEKENQLFDKKLAEEEAWIRQGIKARRTRNQGRVRALKAMRTERTQRREKLGTARLQIQEGQKSGNLVIALDEVTYGYESTGQSEDRVARGPTDGQQPAGSSVIKQFSTVIMRGDKVGIIGPNGAGKSTLLKLMLGQLLPSSGTVKLGTNLQIAWFDQLREQLDPEQTVQQAVGDGSDSIQLPSGKKHVLGYLQDFLFTPDRARMQIKFLSGGERNRIMLAKLFAKPANLIVMDEPTNDLDAETLELLEDRLVEFAGTALVVSHDRAFLNNIVTSTIVFEPEGVNEYVGGYDDWLRQAEQKKNRGNRVADAAGGSGNSNETEKSAGETKKQQADRAASPANLGSSPSATLRKLKYKEKIELEQLPGRIETLEAEIESLNQIVSAPDFYRQAKESIVAQQDLLIQKQAELETAYERWSELDALAEG